MVGPSDIAVISGRIVVIVLRMMLILAGIVPRGLITVGRCLMWRVLLLVIFYVSVVKILTLTLVRVITPVIIERLSLLLASCIEIIPRDLTRGGAWIVPSGLPIERIYRGPVQTVVVALRVVVLIAVLTVTFSIAAKFGTLSPDILLCRSTLLHQIPV